MKKSKRKIAIVGATLGLLLAGGAVQAGTTYSNYNLTVGSFNGSAYTGYQTKTTTGAPGNLRTSSVGGSYTLDARMQASSGTGGWVRRVTDNDTRNLPNSVAKGSLVRLQYSNDATTPVNVQVTGSWRSN